MSRINYNITLPMLITDKMEYLYRFADRLYARHDKMSVNAIVRLYGHLSTQLTDYTIKWSTEYYYLKHIKKCVGNFIGQGEQYGDNLITSVTLVTNIDFFKLTPEDKSIIKQIQNEVDGLFTKFHSSVPVDIQKDLIRTIDQLTKAHQQLTQKSDADYIQDVYNKIFKDLTKIPGYMPKDDNMPIKETSRTDTITLPHYIEEYKWISNINDNKYLNTCKDKYNQLMALTTPLNKETKAIRNTLINGLNYYRKKYDPNYKLKFKARGKYKKKKKKPKKQEPPP